MKYLKKFNESNSDKSEEIKKFCNENLAYLIDTGFELRYYKYPDTGTGQLTIHLFKNSLFEWSEVVDDFTPFLQILNDKYELVKLKPTSERDKFSRKCTISFHSYNYVYRYTLDDLINDRTDGISNLKLDYIEFSIKI